MLGSIEIYKINQPTMSHQPSKSNEDWKITFENEFGGWWNYKSALTERIEDYIQALIDAETKKAVEEERERIVKIAEDLKALKRLRKNLEKESSIPKDDVET